MARSSSDLFAILPNHAPLDRAKAAALLADVVAEADTVGQGVFAAHADFFCWLVEGSPFLARLMRRYPDVVSHLAATSVDDYIDARVADMAENLRTSDDKNDAMAIVRHARNRIALAIALADLADHWDVEQVTAALTQLADRAVGEGLDFLLRQAVAEGGLTQFSRDGLVVLALGKHGGQELNYSSDIDFVVYYTADALPLVEGVDMRKFHIGLVRALAALLQEVTQDGHVFRVDLRLRPDPGATPISISVAAALGYYEAIGQNWERAVYIKARPIAGDIAAGQRFIDDLRPYIWRRYFDFAAIEDVHSMKRQIHAVRGHAEIAAQGHNLKLGRGGIREIEFFVQTQQLIAGGRDPALRGHRTVDMLAMLAEKQWITQPTAARLTASYYYLRRLEHRLQMRLDEQTQTLPRNEESFAQFARFAGYKNAADFTADLTTHLAAVTMEYGQLFEQSESLSAGTGNLVFTGAEDDPETVQTLSDMGFRRAGDISAFIRGWHAGRMGATRSVRAREILTRLQPLILARLAQGGDADDGFIRFHNFLQALPTGVQIFSLFQAHPRVLYLLIDIVTVAPRLAAFLGANSKLVDVLVEETTAPEAPPEVPVDDFEAMMNTLRRYVHEEQFRIGTRTLADPVMAVAHGEAYTQLADTAIASTLAAARADIERQYGHLAHGHIAIIGLGKLGSGEMTLHSDLDLILICDAPDFSALSEGGVNGSQPLDAERWFARLARRFISGLSAPTAEGSLFDVDTRLRPSGNAGPLVTKLSSFRQYQHGEAWTWEHMALTHARMVAGDAALGDKVNTIIAEVLAAPRRGDKLVADVTDMRARLRTHQPQAGPFDIRRGDGGLVDVEFIAQTLQLAHASRHNQLIGARSLPVLLTDLRDAGALDADACRHLLQAAACFASLRQIASLCLEDNETAPALATQSLLLEGLNEPDMSRLTDTIASRRQQAASVFDALMTKLASQFND